MAFSAWRTWSTGEVVTAAHMNQEVRDNGEALFPDEEAGVAWSPTLESTGTNPTTDTVVGRQYRIGAMQFVWARFVIDSAGTGRYTVELPRASVGLSAFAGAGAGHPIGGWHSRDVSSPSNSKTGTVGLRTSQIVQFTADDAAAVTADVPFTWATDDVLGFYAMYLIA